MARPIGALSGAKLREIQTNYKTKNGGDLVSRQQARCVQAQALEREIARQQKTVAVKNRHRVGGTYKIAALRYRLN